MIGKVKMKPESVDKIVISDDRITCPNCSKEVNKDSKLFGLSIICPNCNKPL